MIGRIAAVLLIAAVSFFWFPGHTILQSDTQIYIPILEHLEDESALKNDIMAVRPHVTFTVYDEVSLTLRRLTGQYVADGEPYYGARLVLGN